MTKRWTKYPLKIVRKFKLKYGCSICGWDIFKGEMYYARKKTYAHQRCGEREDLKIVAEIHEL